jgi:hypothetical protein
MDAKCFQVQVVASSNTEALMILRTVVGERLTVSAKIVGPVISVSWDESVRESSDKWLARRRGITIPSGLQLRVASLGRAEHDGLDPF